ncbi:uncharacterized protein LOC141652260 [Silene latifolia]|uniref:uncharacterized protein LOC141652260 n=1 Tax=Silene latifolia TaxID=37657 RepID=UPI003D773BB4
MDSCGVWNVRGMNNPTKQHEIKQFINQNKVELFGIVENKIKSSSRNNVGGTLCENWSICTNSSLHSGGRVWLIWDPNSYEVHIQDITIQNIHAQVFDKTSKKTFWYTVVYGLNKYAEREDLWRSIRNYNCSIADPWLICGDFNVILNWNERIGGAIVTNAEIQPLKNLVHDCNLSDLKATGAFYTWTNKHEHGSKVYIRIDTLLCNEFWFDEYPDSYTHFLPEGMFDHCPCLIQFEEARQRRGASFKYFNMWSLSPDFESVAGNRWTKEVSDNPMFQVVTKLEGLKGELKNLNNEQFGDIENLTHITELILQHFQHSLAQDPLNKVICDAKYQCAMELRELKKARDQFRRQKAK